MTMCVTARAGGATPDPAKFAATAAELAGPNTVVLVAHEVRSQQALLPAKMFMSARPPCYFRIAFPHVDSLRAFSSAVWAAIDLRGKNLGGGDAISV